jgi:hypothetical protein
VPRVINVGGAGFGSSFDDAIDSFSRRQYQDNTLRERQDSDWLQGHIAVMKDMDNTQQAEYLGKLAAADPDRFKRVFGGEIANVKQSLQEQLNAKRTQLGIDSIDDKSNPYRHVIGNTIAVGGKSLGEAVDKNQLDYYMNGPDAGKQSAGIGTGRIASGNEILTVGETTRHHKALEGFEGGKTQAQIEADRARAEASRASAGESQARTETIVQERTPGSGRQNYEIGVKQATDRDNQKPATLTALEKDLERSQNTWNSLRLKYQDLTKSAKNPVAPDDDRAKAVQNQIIAATDSVHKAQARVKAAAAAWDAQRASRGGSPAKKTVTRAKLKAVGYTEAQAKAEGYEVTD